MNDERDDFATLLDSVSDGSAVDWDAAVRDAGPQARARVEALRDVAVISAFHRVLQRGATSEVPAADADSTSVSRWGELLLLERIGSGAYAEVYRAWDPRLRREVALKLLHADGEPASGICLVADSPLLAEGRALARLRHPHVVTVHGIAIHDGRVGLSMELVDGQSLEQLIADHGALSAPEAARLGRDIGSALAAVHDAGILHRDIKPANVVRDPAGRWVLADFGLGRPRGESPAAPPAGSPMYMAPELLGGASPTIRSDVYALGLLVWTALVGCHPYADGTVAALRAAADSGPAPDLRTRRRDLPPRLVAAIEQAIAPRPELRTPGARAFADALSDPASFQARRYRQRVAGIGLAALVVVAAIVAVRRTPSPAPPPAFAVEASFVRRDSGRSPRLTAGDVVRPGDHLSLEFRAPRPAWVYVLNEDEHGERYLLFPQPLYDLGNPLRADSTHVLPGPIAGRENAWTVTSAGGRETFLVVASERPLPELESELARLAGPAADRTPAVGSGTDVEASRLRGTGGLAAVPDDAVPLSPRGITLAHLRDLATADAARSDIWVRVFEFPNPR